MWTAFNLMARVLPDCSYLVEHCGADPGRKDCSGCTPAIAAVKKAAKLAEDNPRRSEYMLVTTHSTSPPGPPPWFVAGRHNAGPRLLSSSS